MQQPAPDPLLRIRALYHFTDRRNLPSIKELGFLYSLNELEKRTISPGYASDEASRLTDRSKNLHYYVHLCFRNKHPMAHVAIEQGRISDAAFLEIDPIVLTWDKVLFSPVLANSAEATFHNIAEARGMIDYDILTTVTNWNDPVCQYRLQTAEKYEILIPKPIPLALVRNFPNG